MRFNLTSIRRTLDVIFNVTIVVAFIVVLFAGLIGIDRALTMRGY